MDFNKFEEETIKWWDETSLHQTMLENNKNKRKFDVLDGPPFLTGTMHHGHALVSTIKDTYGRYRSQQGYITNYQMGFDTHGVPIEQEAEKTVGKVCPTDSIEKLKIFNDECRRIINDCSNDWFDKLGRLGRQFNKDETYYTCSFDYMKTLWWGFSMLYEKGLIYKSKKVMPYSYPFMTPLSNFEASSNYKEKKDLSIYIKINIVNSSEMLLVYTTTPWSLFANQGICVNPELDYVLVCNMEYSDKMWLEASCFETLFKPEEYRIIATKKGKELVGIKYYPIFPLSGNEHYERTRNKLEYIVYGDSFVEKSSGTGIVHLAPMFGADDMRVLKTYGNYTDDMLPEYLVDNMVNFKINYNINGVNIRDTFVMDATKDIVIHLKKMSYIFKSETITHSYPFCCRSDTPLVYMAVDAWFMDIQKLIPDLIENNKKINWSPASVGTERFANWIKDSPDWCLSRNRVWGTPIPIWINEHGKMICISSVMQLEALTDRKFTDLHLDALGDVSFELNGTTFKRTFGVLDCWFESGMAGLSRYGYPECKNASYPVDFIAESLDQTRGWFYTLNVLSTALFNQPAYKNVIVSGLILAEDGKKMSKRLKNYTSPDLLIKEYGADILRLYLLGCPASKAESFCFQDTDLAEIRKKILPYYHAHVFYLECYNLSKDSIEIVKSTNKLDVWIICKFIEFSQQVYSNMEKLQVTYIPNLIFKFIDSMCNMYIKLSRDRLKCVNSMEEYNESISTLNYILNECNFLLAPFMPHLSEYFNRMLGNNTSIHLKSIKEEQDNSLATSLAVSLSAFYSVEELLESVRNLRQKINKPLYYPLNYLILYTDSPEIKEYNDVICSQLNVKEFIIKPTTTLKKIYKPNKTVLGRMYKKEAKKYEDMITSGNINFTGCNDTFYTFDFIVEDKADFIGTKFNYMNQSNIMSTAVVYLNSTTDETNDMEAEINNIRRQINAFRKDLGLKSANKINIMFEQNDYWNNLCSNNMEYITFLSNQLNTKILFSTELKEYNMIETFNGKQLKVSIIKL